MQAGFLFSVLFVRITISEQKLKGKLNVSVEIDSQTRRSIYPLWLRLFTFIAMIAVAVIFLAPSLSPSVSTDPSMPWNEAARILHCDQPYEIKPSPDQPQFTKILRYKTEAEQDGNPRGAINILIYPGGVVRGMWKGEYDMFAADSIEQSSDRPDKIHRIITASNFEGKIVPSKLFIENHTQDPTKLYFITKGNFNIIETLPSSDMGYDISGFIYVRGWLDPNYTATGEIIITKNKKSFETFYWTAQPIP
jgi:hypothetical protein